MVAYVGGGGCTNRKQQDAFHLNGSKSLRNGQIVLSVSKVPQRSAGSALWQSWNQCKPLLWQGRAQTLG